MLKIKSQSAKKNLGHQNLSLRIDLESGLSAVL